jgi:hypothetical protein
MSVNAVSPERLAMLVHHYREALAPDFGCRASTSPEWTDLSSEERTRMVAATRLALLDLQDAPEHQSPCDMRFSQFSGGSEGKECGC